MRRLLAGLLMGFTALSAQTDTLIGYVKTGVNGGPPYYQLVITAGGPAGGGGNAELIVSETLDGGDVYRAAQDPAELAELEKQFTDNGFENLVDSVWISGCLSCPIFALSYRGDSLAGNHPTRSENLNAILAALDALIEKIMQTNPVGGQNPGEAAFHFHPGKLSVSFPHQIKVYNMRGDLLSRRRTSGKNEYFLNRSETPAVLHIVNTATGKRYSRMGFLTLD